jgi:hypothetical protein
LIHRLVAREPFLPLGLDEVVLAVELYCAIDLFSVDAECFRGFEARETGKLGKDTLQRIATLLSRCPVGEQIEIFAT